MTISGKHFEVEKFIALTGLQPYAVRRKGDPLFKTKPDARKIENSGLSLQISDAGFDELDRQIQDALAYFGTYWDQLSEIANFGIDNMTVDFGINNKTAFSNGMYETLRFPRELLQQLSNLGADLHLSIYADGEEE